MRLAAAAVVILIGCTAVRAADRRIVVDPNTPPWTAVAKVQTNIGTRCTGALIAPAIVLTAAHCLYNRRTRAMLQPVSLHVLFGYERAGYRFHRRVTRFTTGPGFRGGSRRPQPGDWAQLYLSEPVPVKPLPFFDGASRPGMAVALAGYNQDRTELLMADLACHVLRVATLPGGGGFLLHDCDAARGTSGAPLLVRESGAWAAVGLNIAAGRDANLALSPPLAERVQASKP